MTRARTTADITTDSSGLPEGSVIQVVETHVGEQATTSALANENASYAVNFTSTSWASTSTLSTSITPTSVSSKLLLSLCIFAHDGSTTGTGAPAIRIVRGSTVVWT